MNKNKIQNNFLKDANKKIKTINEDFQKIKENKNFISFDKLLWTILLKSLTTFKNQDINKILFLLKEAIKNKFDIVFDNFTISFVLSNYLNNLFLIPTILEKSSSNFESINLKSDSKLFKIDITKFLNNELNYLLEKQYFIEILNDLIIKKNSEENKIEIYYNESNITGW
ncbi:MSC_0623 family F1-like ATPase-associated protein [Metamycoplasma canadense]|uniref:Uncharacterized protein n=1 Tax=Metamycoplasma canadense TaxID=29554 RepID=A0A077L7H8_9BACT|nr:DUF2714 domain-containing protein [Metamycoplasma canadense]BAP39781.1 hypothetical protein MCAN360_0757 [Metamycoplasma canadense]